VFSGLSVTLGNFCSCAQVPPLPSKGKSLIEGVQIIDAHAHPDQFYDLTGTSQVDNTSTLRKIKNLRMAASSFAAVGDFRTGTLSFDEIMRQINYVTNLERKGQVGIIRRHSDLHPSFNGPDFKPGAILALEGASPLGTTPKKVTDNLDLLYGSGVRMISLMHFLDNQFGRGMHHPGKDGPGLTDLGRHLVERMMSLGIVIDAVHAHYATLKDIAEIAVAHGIPIIDSHTSLSPAANPVGSRLRTWEEMRIIARTDGLICTWPLQRKNPWPGRLTIKDWAKENHALKTNLGNRHIGLGTDGGGLLPETVSDYKSIMDLPKLIGAMAEEGFDGQEIAGYMGGNLGRILQKCIG